MISLFWQQNHIQISCNKFNQYCFVLLFLEFLNLNLEFILKLFYNSYRLYQVSSRKKE